MICTGQALATVQAVAFCCAAVPGQTTGVSPGADIERAGWSERRASVANTAVGAKSDVKTPTLRVKICPLDFSRHLSGADGLLY